MKFDNFEKLDVNLSETDTAKRLSSLHKGFESRFTEAYSEYMDVGEKAQRGIATWIGENAALTMEVMPDAMKAIKEMYDSPDIYECNKLDLAEINSWKINVNYKYQCLKQHAGYAAEVISTAKENLMALREDSDIVTQRADDRPDLFPKNDQYVDKIRVDKNTGDVIERIQTKFVGKDAKECLDKLMSKDFDKYFVEDKVDKVEIPKDYYNRVKMLAQERMADLEKQIERLKADGNEEALASREARLERLKLVMQKIEKSTVTNFEAKLAVEHPELYQKLIFANECNIAGVESGLGAAGLTAAVSTVDNIQKYMGGEITAVEAAKDIALDTATAGAVGYGTGFVSYAVAASMSSSSHQLIQAVGGSCAPAAVVSWGVQSFEATMEFAQGNISTGELAYELGQNAAEVAGGIAGGIAGAKAGAVAGAAIGSVIPGAGTAVGAGVGAAVGAGAGFVGSMVGCAVASEAYATAVEYGGKGAEVMAAKAQELATNTVEMAKTEVPEKVDFIRESINSFATENKIPIRV